MPEFVLPAEADHCPHCGAVLTVPPNCCERMRQEDAAEMSWQCERLARRRNGEDYGDDADAGY